MEPDKIKGFSQFVGIEETNLITSMANLGGYYFFIHNMDLLYLSCFDLEPIDEEKFLIPAFLCLVCQSEFYSAMVSFLRLHKSKSYRSLRVALDSVFTAYYLLKNPDKTDIYMSPLTEDGNPEWKKIFLNIKKTIKNDSSNFPLADGLPEIHEFCSIYSHSDALGILHKYFEDKEQSRVGAKFFDYELKAGDHQRHFGYLLNSFYRIYLIFWNEIFKQRAGDKLSAIESNITIFNEKLQEYMKQYPIKTD